MSGPSHMTGLVTSCLRALGWAGEAAGVQQNLAPHSAPPLPTRSHPLLLCSAPCPLLSGHGPPSHFWPSQGCLFGSLALVLSYFLVK